MANGLYGTGILSILPVSWLSTSSIGRASIVMAELDDHSKKIVKVRELMHAREKARKGNDFALSDTLREKLKKDFGVEVVDQVGGPSGWKFIDGSTRKMPNVDLKLGDDSKKKRKVDETDKTTNDKNSKQQKSSSTDIKKELKPKKEEKGETPEQIRNKDALKSLLGTTNGGKTVQGVLIEEIKVGAGRTAESGKRVKVHYVGKLKSNGRVFDASKNKPFAFRLGAGEVIRGWDIGVAGMCVGGKRTLTIPPEKAYGKAGAPPTIPSNATLVFEVSLLEVL